MLERAANRPTTMTQNRRKPTVREKQIWRRQTSRESVVDRIGAGELDRRPSQNLPPTAIYCHFVAVKSLRSFQTAAFHFVAQGGRAGQPWARTENRERGPRGASVGGCRRVQFVYSDAPNEAICPKSIGVGTCDRIGRTLDWKYDVRKSPWLHSIRNQECTRNGGCPMRELEKPVARVFRRLRFQRFMTTLVWTWAIALFIVAALIGTEKLLNQHIAGPDWLPFAVAGLIGMAIAAAISLSTGPSRMDAAVALDRVFHLNERVSSAFSLPADLRETPAGRALIADAARKVADLDVAAEFGLRLPRRAWVILIPATAAVVLLFAPAWVPLAVQARMSDKIDIKAIAKQTELLTKKIASQRQAIDKEKFPEAEKLLAKIEKKAEELAKAPPAAKDKLMVELNALTDALKDRQKQLGSPEQVNRQLQQLKEMAKQGPGDQFAKDLARGDFKKAADQLQKLQEKLQSGKMTEADKKALKEQLTEMSKKLSELANLEQRKKQLEEARKNGGLTEQQFQREMDKLTEQSKSLKQLAQLASKLGNAADALQKGDAKKAADSLGMTQQQMSDMAKQLDEMESLDAAMADLARCRRTACRPMA